MPGGEEALNIASYVLFRMACIQGWPLAGAWSLDLGRVMTTLADRGQNYLYNVVDPENLPSFWEFGISVHAVLPG